MENKIKKKAGIEMESELPSRELANLTGLSEEQCRRFMTVNNMKEDDALEAIDIFMQCLNDNIAVPLEVAGCMQNAGIYSGMANHLGAYNTMRGGVKGYGGFVFEELHAADKAVKGADITVLRDNGTADFIVRDTLGHETLLQAKTGYKTSQPDWSKHNSAIETIVVDKGNTELARKARDAGFRVEESAVFKKHADVVARAQQWESKITGKPDAPVTATATGAHAAGLASAKLAARVGVPVKLGENIYDVTSGKKTFEDAAADIIVEGATTIGGAYATTVVLTVAETAAGAAATTFAGTTAGAAVTGAVSTVAAAAGSTAVGGVVAAGAATVATTVASAATAVAAAPLTPLLLGGAAIGFIGKWISDNW